MDGIGFRFVFRVRIACDGFLTDRFKTIRQICKVDCAEFERVFVIIPEIRVFACEARESCLPGRGTRRREPRFPPSYSAQRKSENGELPEGQERVLQDTCAAQLVGLVAQGRPPASPAITHLQMVKKQPQTPCGCFDSITRSRAPPAPWRCHAGSVSTRPCRPERRSKSEHR